METEKFILGISAFYHDSAAAVIKDGIVIAAAQEERFTRKKHDPGFPAQAVKYCLAESGLALEDIHAIVFYDKPLLKFERLLETYLSYAPRGIRSFIAAMPIWLKEKLFLKSELKKSLQALQPDSNLPPLYFSEHHLSHAASAFFPSPFEEAAVLCIDGVGEWATTSAWAGRGNRLEGLWQIDFPHSLGLLYSAFTYYTGFKVNSGEYKLMGLAPYGKPVYADLIREHLIDIRDDGTYKLDMKYFDYATGLRMTSRHFHKLFGGLPREPESEVTQREMDLAASVQEVLEKVILKLAHTLCEETGLKNLCLSGGVALNCVANGKLLESGIVDNLWIQPAAGDAGGALGAAQALHHHYYNGARNVIADDAMQGSYLGPAFTDEQIRQWIDTNKYSCQQLSETTLSDNVATLLDQGSVIGWFQGRMEFGPRALGSRSIIGDPRNTDMQSQMNLKIKYRESFRPFAPAILAGKVSDWFELDKDSPYMLLVAQVKQERCYPDVADTFLAGIEKLKVPRSEIPAVTHVDYSARVQTVSMDTNPRFCKLLEAFEEKTECPVLVNTSFNVRGEPIVNTPDDAYRCFMRTEMDYLVLGNCLLSKSDQPVFKDTSDWLTEFELD
ncbi:MAG: carbamoyltransferase [Gammaproteobacteria bacterium]|nr:carbamoyltransferase [Gammaproteobacteria bacterium]